MLEKSGKETDFFLCQACYADEEHKTPGGRMSVATEGYMVRKNIMLVHGLNCE